MMKDKINNRISELVERDGALSNDDLVQIIEHVGGYLNLKTPSAYAKAKGLSYNGVKNHRKCVELFGVKFVIDND